MIQQNGLAELAAQAATLPSERRQELEKQLPLNGNPCFNEGLAVGLASAAEAARQQSPEVAASLRELAAVAAAFALEEQRGYEQARKLLTPTARAEIDAEIARIESGEVELVPVRNIIPKLKEMERIWKEKQDGSQSSKPT